MFRKERTALFVDELRVIYNYAYVVLQLVARVSIFVSVFMGFGSICNPSGFENSTQMVCKVILVRFGFKF